MIVTLDNCEEWFYQQPEKLTFIELNFQIGYMQGEQSAYMRFKKVCNECRNKDK